VQNIWKCERGEGEAKMRCRDRAPEEIGQGPFSTGSSDEPVLKVQLWPSKFDLNPFVPVRSMNRYKRPSTNRY
jgi:hypothetical protein